MNNPKSARGFFPRSSRINLLLLGATLVALGGYLLWSRGVFRIGFPLDDAWIHQTYARSLAHNAEWSFIPGQLSAGSTAPAWSLILAVGHLFGLGPYVWTFLLGMVILYLLAVAGIFAFRALAPDRIRAGLWVGLFLIFEWHLVWSAGSGMETLLYALLVLGALGWLVYGVSNWFVLGLLIGLSLWIRPDGITLVGPALMVLVLNTTSWKRRLSNLVWFLFGALALAGPYLAFNQAIAGAWWPNTFFAKQAEYAILRQQPLLLRFGQQLALPLIGAGVILMPGFLFTLIRAFRCRNWGALVGGIWFIGYLLVYALRLPVVYQHGRYIMPAMPVYFVWSLAGIARWVQPASRNFWARILSRAWLLAIVLVTLVFYFQGARAYALDVAVIESEMVDTARWVAQNTEPGALIAAHDIGALGYFGERRILDLAGLISPEVIPFIRDEARLEIFLNDHGAVYLVTFPGGEWYPYLTSRAELIFETGAAFSPLFDRGNMSVYRWSAR